MEASSAVWHQFYFAAFRAGITSLSSAIVLKASHGARARELARLRADIAEAERAIGNLTRAIAAGGRLEPNLVELKARQRRRDELLGLVRAGRNHSRNEPP